MIEHFNSANNAHNHAGRNTVESIMAFSPEQRFDTNINQYVGQELMLPKQGLMQDVMKLWLPTRIIQTMRKSVRC